MKYILQIFLFRLLDVYNNLVRPINMQIRLLIRPKDVIHLFNDIFCLIQINCFLSIIISLAIRYT